MNVKLVPATKLDIGEVNTIMKDSKAYWGYDENFMKKFMDIFQVTEDYLDSSITKILYKVCGDGEIPIGFFSISYATGEGVELDNFFITPEQIGKGYGKKLWDHMLETMKPLKASTFTLWSDPGAEGFYRKMSCIKIGNKESPMLPGRKPAIYQYSMTNSLLD